MKPVNAFKIPKGKNKRIEYSSKVLEAVLDPRKTIQTLYINGGYDWIDQKYGFIKLLLTRGQILEVVTHSDLLACQDYLDAMEIGVRHSYSFSCKFEAVIDDAMCSKGAWASIKRMDAARERYIKFVNEEVPKRRAQRDAEFKRNLDSISFKDIQAHRASKAGVA